MIVGSYGEDTARPMLIPNQSALFVSGGGGSPPRRDYLVFTGFHIYNAHKDPGHELYKTEDEPSLTVTWLMPAIDVLFEDVHLEYASWNIQSSGERFVIRRSITEKNYSSSDPGGHAQGIFTQKVVDLVIEESIFDHNGFIDRDCITAACLDPSQGATIFNHNLYLAGDSGPAIVRRNIIARASSHGMQARSGAHLEDNLFMRNPLAGFVSGGAKAPYHEQLNIVRNNVVLEGNDINSDTPRGFGLDHNSAYESLFEGNILANMLPETSQHNNRAFGITCGGYDHDLCSSTFRNNLAYNWTNAQGRGEALHIGGDANHYDSMLIENNQMVSGSNSSMVNLSLPYAGLSHLLTFQNNSYYQPDIFTDNSIFNAGSGSTSFASWQSQVEPTATAATAANFPQPCRTAATYYHEVILGNNPSNNCDIMHDDTLFEAFMDNAKYRSRSTDPEVYKMYSADTFNKYIREGFGR